MGKLPDSALKYVLMGLLVPYSEANLKLSFKPNLFFNDLEKIDAKKQYSRKHLQNTYYKAKKAGLIDVDAKKRPFLTGRGKAMLALYSPAKLEKSELMVIFDIPEQLSSKRRALRRTLQECRFRQVQRSVWITQYDCKDYLLSELAWLGIGEYVQMYEVVKLS
jgi:DNA-binding transcriptional regulator PaaX